MEKMYDCRYSMPSGDAWGCIQKTKKINDIEETTEEKCEACKNFKSRYIEYPINVTEIEDKFQEWISRSRTLALVKIRPCAKEYEGKTYVGILLGDLPISLCVRYDEESGKLSISPHQNPAIFVPELGKIIFGCESWWGRIKDTDELKDITDEDIDNVWYVKLLKGMNKDK